MADTATPKADPPAPKADGFEAPSVYADIKNGGSGNTDLNDPDD